MATITPLLDAIVVGAGPAGSAAAATLARHGHRVMLIDRAHFPRDKPCGDYCDPGAGQALDELGCRAEVLAAGAVPISTMIVIAQDGTGFEAPFPSGSGLLLRRIRLDASLLAHAARRGADVLEGVGVDSVRVDDGYVEARAEHARVGAFRARLLIAADGMRSTTAHRLGLLTTVPRERYTVGAYFSGLRGASPRGELHLGPNLYCGVAYFGEGAANVCMALPRSFFRHRTPEQAFRDGLRFLPSLADTLVCARRETAYRCTGPVGFTAHEVVTDRVMLVGDAAGQIEPMTGQGIFLALRSGMLAAEVAARALATGNLSQQSLRAYACRRSEEIDGKLRLARWLQRLVFRTRLAPHLVKRLAVKPELASQLLGVTGDVLPPHALRSLWFVLRLMMRPDANGA